MKLLANSRIAMSLLVGSVFLLITSMTSIAQGRPPEGVPPAERDSRFFMIVNSREIPLRSMGWGVTNYARGRAGGIESGTVIITKERDDGTSRLINNALSGRNNSFAVIARNRSGRDTVRYRMEDAAITSHVVNRGNPPTETFTLSFRRISGETIGQHGNNWNSSNRPGGNRPGGNNWNGRNQPMWNSMSASRPNLNASWDRDLLRSRLNWTAPSGTVVSRYKIFACPGTRWRSSAAQLLDTVDNRTLSYTTDFGLRRRGDTVLFRITAVTNSGDRDSLDAAVTRP